MDNVVFKEVCIWDNSKGYHTEAVALMYSITIPDALAKAKTHGIDFIGNFKLSLEVTN